MTVWSEASGPLDAPPIVLVHGAMDRSAGLLRLSRRLSDRFRVIRYDRRGYGRSTGVGPPFTIDAHIDDLAEVVDQATGGGVSLAFGHSLGGNVALGLAQRRPELVERVAIYETPLSWLPWWPEGTAGSTALGAADPADAAEAFMRRLVGDDKWARLPPSTRSARRAEGPAMVGELADYLEKQKDSNGKAALVGFSNGGILATGASTLDPKINAAVIYYGTDPWPLGVRAKRFPPLLVLHGDADQIIPVDAGKELAAEAKQLGAPVDLVIYPGESHGFGADFSKKNATDALNRTIAFLRKQLEVK